MADKTAQYGAGQIQVLEGLDPVRKRPGMYIGGTGSDGLHHLIVEVVDNAIDEAMAGQATTIEVVLLADGGVRVSDNGRGIPVEKHPQTGLSALETVLTRLHAGGKFGSGGYKVSGGLHGVGVSVVNALSSRLVAEVRRDNKLWRQEFKLGKPLGPVKLVGSSTETGTTITFWPDVSVFESTKFNYDIVLDYLRHQAFLTKGTLVRAIDEVDSQRYSYYFEGGIRSYVTHLNKDKEVVNEPMFYVDKTIEGVAIEVAIQYTNGFSEQVKAIANNVFNPDGGTHLTGFRTALTRVLNDYARKAGALKDNEENLTGEDCREGLTAVISVKMPDPQFEGQTKAKLNNPEVRGYVEQIMGEWFSYYLEENPNEGRKIVAKATLSARARVAARAARDTVIRKGALEGMTLPGKLADCRTKDTGRSELFIVEGISAGGSAKDGRDSEFQAILPLRGKVLNVERARLDKMLANTEIKNLIIALGTGIAEQFDLAKLRYQRVVLMADADVDGAHIRTLLLTFFYRHMPKIIEEGHLYIAQPPLYLLQAGKHKHYAYSDEERDQAVERLTTERRANKLQAEEPSVSEDEAGSPESEEGQPDAVDQTVVVEDETKQRLKAAGVTNIQRYKGLSEMNPQELWETTMDPANRILLQVSVEDAEKADAIFNKLMGEEVLLRKNFIQTHARSVVNLDI